MMVKDGKKRQMWRSWQKMANDGKRWQMWRTWQKMADAEFMAKDERVAEKAKGVNCGSIAKHGRSGDYGEKWQMVRTWQKMRVV